MVDHSVTLQLTFRGRDASDVTMFYGGGLALYATAIKSCISLVPRRISCTNAIGPFNISHFLVLYKHKKTEG